MDIADTLLKYQDVTIIIEKHLDEINKIVLSTDELLEGNTFFEHNTKLRFPNLLTKQLNLFWAGSQAKKSVLEIGFNAGHSALLFLLGNGGASEYTFFDLGEHAYVLPCMEYLKQQFPNIEMTYYKGDSKKNLPMYLNEKPEKKGTYDLVHVDGGHDLHFVLNDVACAVELVAPGGLLILDDTNINYINMIADACIISGDFTEEKILDTVGYQHRILHRRVTNSQVV